jgi:hypothetical protein
MTPTQEIRTFHGAQCICDFGVKSTAPCKIPSCGICNIVRSSFNAFAFGASYNTGRHVFLVFSFFLRLTRAFFSFVSCPRYGKGVYSYENPVLADKFATSCASSPYRIVIACDVASPPKGANNQYSMVGYSSTISQPERSLCTPQAAWQRAHFRRDSGRHLACVLDSVQKALRMCDFILSLYIPWVHLSGITAWKLQLGTEYNKVSMSIV